MSERDPKNMIENDAVRAAVSEHPRLWEENRYVYPVLSRRSKGVSIGVNLNPDKICNFDCIYCQVDRDIAPVHREVDLDILSSELKQLMTWVHDGTLFERPPFEGVPDSVKRVNDIAFSGDGEPTSNPRFHEVVQLAAETRDALGLDDVKLVVITNCTLFQRDHVRNALDYLDAHNGEIWAKLDAGTEDYYKKIDRTRVSFSQILENIKTAANARPLVIQSLFMKVDGAPPPEAEIDAYCDVLSDVLNSGGDIKLVQLYTVARQPAEDYVAPLSNEAMDRLGDSVRMRVGAPVEVYYGVS
jgi:wyosine [tRNA(Phe)-imidazoG37] synthetase (radical SAM superfamily)